MEISISPVQGNEMNLNLWKAFVFNNEDIDNASVHIIFVVFKRKNGKVITCDV